MPAIFVIEHSDNRIISKLTFYPTQKRGYTNVQIVMALKNPKSICNCTLQFICLTKSFLVTCAKQHLTGEQSLIITFRNTMIVLLT